MTDHSGRFSAIETQARHGRRWRPSRALAALMRIWDRSRQRRHLRDLDDRMLRDVGLSRADVARETAKPVWRA